MDQFLVPSGLRNSTPKVFPPKISLRLSVCVCVYQVCVRRLLDINVHLQRDRILRWFVCFVFFHIKKQQRKVRVLKANVWVQTGFWMVDSEMFKNVSQLEEISFPPQTKGIAILKMYVMKSLLWFHTDSMNSSKRFTGKGDTLCANSPLAPTNWQNWPS